MPLEIFSSRELPPPQAPWAALERAFPNVEMSARRFWEGIAHLGGTLDATGGDRGYTGALTGEAVYHRDRDSALYPIECAADVSVGDDVWRVRLRRVGSKGATLEVKLAFPASKLDVAESLLDVTVPPMVVFNTAMGSREKVAALYERICALTDEARPAPLDHGDLPKFTILPDGRLAPYQVLLLCTAEGRTLRIAINLLFGTVEIECDADLQTLARELLAPPAESNKDADGRAVSHRINVSGHDWSRVGGLDVLRARLEEWVEAPLANPELFRRLGLRPPRGVLLAGPPGTGKTLVAKVLACQSRAAFLYADPSDLMHKWFGESEQAIAALFEEARAAAKEHGRALLFFDEVDGLFTSRDDSTHEVTQRIMAQLLTELDGLRALEGVMVLAATNRVEDIDPALLRPGRFDYVVEVGLPDCTGRRAIYSVHLSGKPLGALDLDRLADASEGLSGAQIEHVVTRATFAAARREALRCGVDLSTLTAFDEIRIEQGDLESALAELRAEPR